MACEQALTATGAGEKSDRSSCLAWAAVPFEPLNGESADDPVVAVMLGTSFAIAAAVVLGAPAAVHAMRRQIR